MSFADALTGNPANTAGLERGWNGSAVHSSTGSKLVDAFTKLMRATDQHHKTGKHRVSKKLSKQTIDSAEGAERVRTLFGVMLDSDDMITVADAFMLWAHIRDIHHGKGEKLVALQCFLELWRRYPETSFQVLRLYPSYGYYKDWFMLHALIVERGETELYIDLIDAIVYLTAHQLVQDYNALSSGEVSVSLLGKWCPREGKALDVNGLYNKIANFYTSFTTKLSEITTLADAVSTVRSSQSNISQKRQKGYNRTLRTALSALTAHLKIYERFACAKQWSLIDPSKVPSVCANRQRFVMLDEDRNGTRRHPEDADRTSLRDKTIEHITSGDVKVSGLHPHEFYKNAIGGSPITRLLANKQWEAKVTEVLKMIEDYKATLNDEQVADWANLLPMGDVSGSMTWGCASVKPIDVSVALTLFLTSLNERRGLDPLCVTFTERPMAFNLSGDSLSDRYCKLMRHIGYGTNFEAAMNLVLDAMKKTGQIFDLVVFTDGQFDAFDRSNWATAHQNILRKVSELGLPRAPKMIFWNLNASAPGFETNANYPGVQFLSGYSPALLKFLFIGDSSTLETVEVRDEVTGETHEVTVSTVTPYDTARAALDEDYIDPIREILSNSTEGILVDYTWSPRTIDEEQ
jgi:hypothetical protein